MLLTSRSLSLENATLGLEGLSFRTFAILLETSKLLSLLFNFGNVPMIVPKLKHCNIWVVSCAICLLRWKELVSGTIVWFNFGIILKIKNVDSTKFIKNTSQW